MTDLVAHTALLLTIAAAVAAAIVDVKRRRIPNLHVAIMLACTLVYLGAQGLPTLGEHLVTGFYVGAFCVLLFHRKVIGGGDAKMIAVLSLWFAPRQVGGFFIVMLMVGGVLGAVWILLSILRIIADKWAPRLPLPRFGDRAGMPYGVATAVGFALMQWRAL